MFTLFRKNTLLYVSAFGFCQQRRYVVNAIVISIFHARFEAGKYLFQLLSRQIPRLVNRAAMVTPRVYVAVPITIHNGGIPRAYIMFFLNEPTFLQALIKFRKDRWVATAFVILHPKSGRTLVRVADHHIDCVKCSLFVLFVSHVGNLR